MENLIVALIVVAAAVFTVRTFYKGLKGKSTCGCSCDSCGTTGGCETETLDSRK